MDKNKTDKEAQPKKKRNTGEARWRKTRRRLRQQMMSRRR